MKKDKKQRVRVFVGGVPSYVDSEALKTLFSTAGNILSATVKETDTVAGIKRWGYEVLFYQ